MNIPAKNNHNASVFILVTVIFVLGLILLLNNRKTPDPRQSGTSTLPVSTSDSDIKEVMPPAAGGYADYDPSHLSFANEGKLVLFFNAQWCPTCRALTKDIQNNVSVIPEDVLILNTDYDSEKDLRRKYGVTYQHTLVQIDSLGNQIKKWSGSPDLRSLLDNVK